MLKVVRMPAKKSKKSVKGKNHIDVRKTEDIPILADILKKNKIVFVLFYADYCGHCHTYMGNTWNKLVLNPNRKIGMASVHHDQLEKTPFASTKVSGYPTIVAFGKDKVNPIKFKNKDTGVEEIEYPESRNNVKMTEIMNSEPDIVLESMEPSNPGNISKLDETLELSQNSENSRMNAANSDPTVLINSIETEKPSLKPKKMATVPNYKEDQLNSQSNSNSNSLEFMNQSTEKPATGGSLYKALLEGLPVQKKQTKRRKSLRGKKTRRA